MNTVHLTSALTTKESELANNLYCFKATQLAALKLTLFQRLGCAVSLSLAQPTERFIR